MHLHLCKSLQDYSFTLLESVCLSLTRSHSSRLARVSVLHIASALQFTGTDRVHLVLVLSLFLSFASYLTHTHTLPLSSAFSQ